MKKISTILSVCFALILFSSCSPKAYLFTSFHEPADQGLRLLYSYDGLHWTDMDTIFIRPAVGQQKVMRDPSMVQAPDGTFHLVWTSSWRGDKGFGYASSKDLIHWSEEQLIPVMQNEPTTVNVWAPEIFYDDEKKQYDIVWASCIPGRFEKGEEEDSNNHRLYVTTTTDFKIFGPTKLFLDPGFSAIDATVVKCGHEDYVLIVKDNTRPNRNIKIAFANDPLGPWTNATPSFTETYTEGPSYVRLKNEWIIYFDAYRKKTYDAISTKDFNAFANANSRISIPVGHKHGTIVTVKKKFVRNLVKKMKH